MRGTLRTLARPTTIAILALLVLGVVFAAGGLKLGIWADGGPGAGLLPAAAAALLLGLTGIVLFTRSADDERFHREPLAAIILACGFALLAPRIGVLVPTFLLVVAWVRFLYGQSWLQACLLGAGLAAGGVGLFHYLLKVPMTLVAGVL